MQSTLSTDKAIYEVLFGKSEGQNTHTYMYEKTRCHHLPEMWDGEKDWGIEDGKI